MYSKILYLGACFFLVLVSCTKNSSSTQGQPSQPAKFTGENPAAIEPNLDIDLYAGRMVFYGSGIDLQASQIQLQGYLQPAVYPGTTALIAVPGRLGLSEAFKTGLKAFSDRGYNVLAVDLYNRVPGSLAEGKILETSLGEKGLPDILANLSQAKKFATQQFQPTRVVLIGWDTGGKWAATAALTSQGTFAAVVSYTGKLSLLQSYQPSDLRTPILGIFAVNDTETAAADMMILGAQYQK